MHGSWLSLLMMLAIVGSLLTGLAVWFMALLLLKPPRMTDGKAAWVLQRLSPGDLGLAFEEVSFHVREEKTGSQLKIAGWWIPHPHAAGRCVVLIHGYADAKVGSIAWAPTFHAIDCNILAIDLRAHGESGGTYSTAGFFERADLGQVLDQLRAERPGDTSRLALFGVSLGAAVAVATAAEREDLAGIILECPFPDYRVPAMAHAKLLGAPGAVVESFAYTLAQRLSGADFSAVRPVDLIRLVRCPVLMIHSGADVLLTATDVAPLVAAARARPAAFGALTHWVVESAHHLAAIYVDPVGYQHRIAGFLQAAFGDPVAAEPTR